MHQTFDAYKVPLKKLYKSIWFFPALLTLLLIILTAFKISGSSIGIYHEYFYGKSKDPNLVLNQPQNIRSDEWVVNTQMTIAQSNSDYERINSNIGYGQDMSIMSEPPYKDWSAAFRPQNFVFFTKLPFDFAFAFRWWFVGYLLILSLYFLSLQFLQNKRLLSSIIALSVFFSPFIQWWYLYGTIATVYHSFFAALLLMLITKTNKLKLKLAWSVMFFYNFACFLLVLYPPFQIPALLVILFFTIGHLFDLYRSSSPKSFFVNLAYVFSSSLAAIFIFLLFYISRSQVFNIINNTAYPGNRIIESGGFDIYHFFSSNLAFLQQFTRFSNNYLIGGSVSNPSESSNFILLLPFLIIPLLYSLWKSRDKKGLHHTMLTVALTFGFFVFILWLFVPKLELVGKLLLLNMVPHNRLLIGFGILGYLCLLLLINKVSSYKKPIFKTYQSFIYSVACFAIIAVISIKLAGDLPQFITIKKALVLSIPIPVIIFLILNKKFILAMLGLLSFSIFSTAFINPLYKGTDLIQRHPLPYAIQKYSKENLDSRWITDESALENFIVANGAKSLTGVFAYPQIDIWKNIEEDTFIYNRYAHTNYVLDRNPLVNKTSELQLVGADNFGILTEPCSDFLKDNDVEFIITRVKFQETEVCTSLIETIVYPEKQFYIYQITE